MDGLDETVDPPYLVPTHLREAQSIGPIPVRTFFVVLVSGLLLGAPVAAIAYEALGDVGLLLGLLPIVLAAPFAVPWLDPPAEHGALLLLAFLGQKVVRSVTWLRLPPRAELAEADGLRAFLRVVFAYRRTAALGLEEQPDLARLHVA